MGQLKSFFYERKGELNVVLSDDQRKYRGRKDAVFPRTKAFFEVSPTGIGRSCLYEDYILTFASRSWERNGRVIRIGQIIKRSNVKTAKHSRKIQSFKQNRQHQKGKSLQTRCNNH